MKKKNYNSICKGDNIYADYNKLFICNIKRGGLLENANIEYLTTDRKLLPPFCNSFMVFFIYVIVGNYTTPLFYELVSQFGLVRVKRLGISLCGRKLKESGFLNTFRDCWLPNLRDIKYLSGNWDEETKTYSYTIKNLLFFSFGNLERFPLAIKYLNNFNNTRFSLTIYFKFREVFGYTKEDYLNYYGLPYNFKENS